MKAEIYTKEVCPHCVRAKKYLEKNNVEYVEIDAVANIDALKSRVLDASGRLPKTVPQIFIDGGYIGGADELESFL